MILNVGNTSSNDLPLEFSIGQVVKHRRYGYRGVILDLDLRCRADDTWYWKNQTQPRRDQPWYHVLVHHLQMSTYAAQENLLPDLSGEAIDHPLVQYFFVGFENDRYIRNDRPWPTDT